MNYRSGIIGRSDLAAVYARGGASLASITAELIGMEHRSDDTAGLDLAPPISVPHRIDSHPQPEHTPEQRPDLSLWICTGRKLLQPLPEENSEEAVHCWHVSEDAQPAVHHLAVPWPDLGPRLRRLVCEDVFSRKVDVQQLVNRVARLSPVSRVPLLKERSWSPELWVIADNSTRLAPFHIDMEAIIAELRTIVPCGSMHVVRGAQPNALWLWDSADSTPQAVPCASPPPGAHLLVLSDLGLYSGTSEFWQMWLEWCQRVRSDGGRMLVLFPGDVTRIPAQLRELIHAVSWIPSSCEVQEQESRDALVRQLLILAAPTIRLEPGLLRDLRLLLPYAHDATLELDAWNSPMMSGVHPMAATLDRDLTKSQLLPAFELLAPEIRRAALMTIRGWRLHFRHAPEIWFEELMNLSVSSKALLPDDVEDARHSVRFYSQERNIDSRRGQRCRVWMYNSTNRIDDQAYADPVVGKVLRKTRRELHQEPNAVLQETDLRELPTGVTRTIRLILCGSQLRAIVGDRMQINPATIELKSSVPYLRVQSDFGRLDGTDDETIQDPGNAGKPMSSYVEIPDSGNAVFPLPCPHIRISSNLEELDLKRVTRPDWAVAWGVDMFGQYADFEVPRGSGTGKVRQRLRWIPPGEFVMGSPTDEPGRYDNELQHCVTISSGFWMFDTPCTQDLWEAVNGNNPSYFQDPLRPVEQVSWDDARQFAETLSKHVPRLNFNLPTEAQWEYACRAGTGTALYSGPTEIIGENNAPALDPIAWYGGNSGKEYDIEVSHPASNWKAKQYAFEKAGSRRVKLKARNPWGLYDLLGNVWEWCSDWYDEYNPSILGDPTGPEKGSFRVVRGGSCFDYARDVRSACRFRYDPGLRLDYLGFRLLSLAEPEPAQDTSITPSK